MTDEKKTPLLDFSKIVAPRRPNVEANMYAGQEFTPEAAAVGVRAQRDHGIPASMAAADNTMVPTPKLDFSAINKSKPLANYASTPAGAAVIRDDITGLSALDDVLRAFGRDFRQQMEILSDTGTAIKSGFARADANIYGFLAAPFGVVGQAVDPLVGKVIPNNPFSEGESFLLGKSKEMAGFADAQLAPVLAKQKGYAKDAMEGLASLPASAAGMAMVAVTKNPAFGYGSAGVQSGGAAYAQGRNEGLPALDSMMYGTNAGMISAVSEMIPAIKYVEDMAAGTKLHKVIVGQLATEMPGEQFDAHMGDLNEWAYLNPDKTLAEYAAERPDVAIKTMVATIAATVAQTAAVSTTASVVTEVGEMKKRRDVATRAEAAQKSVKAMAEHIKATKMLGRDPDGLAGLVTQIAEEGGAPSTVYIDAADLTGVLLQSNMTIHDMAELIPAVGPQMVDAFMAGGTVEIPVGEALVRLSGTAIEEAMMPHIRLEADGYSAEQAKKFVAEYEGQQMAKAEGILKKFAEDSEFRQSAARIRRQVQDELTAIDPASPESAATRAKLFEAFFVTAARDWGGEMTPGKLFDRLYKGRPVVVGRDSQQAGGADLTQPSDRSVDVGYDIATPEFKEKFGASKAVDEEGAPLTVYHGTQDKNFTRFRVGNAEAYGDGIYFATDKTASEEEFGSGGRVIAAHVRIENPWDESKALDLESMKTWEKFKSDNPDFRGDAQDAFENYPDFRGAAIREAGYDGIIQNSEEYGQEVVVFSPDQIISRDSGVLHQSPVFYSALERGILGNEKLQKGTAEQWLGFLSKLPGVKRDEIDAVGLPDFLALQTGAITRDQVLEFVRGNGVQIKDVELGAAKGEDAFRKRLEEMTDEELQEQADEDMVEYEGRDRDQIILDILSSYSEGLGSNLDQEVGGTKYGKYQLPGGKNYRELLLTLPIDRAGVSGEVIEDGKSEKYPFAVMVNGREYNRTETRKSAEDDLQDVIDIVAKRKNPTNYKSGHWDAPNVLAHVRFNERTGANGERILHLEEVQSDWHQAGRKEGYRTENEKRFAGLVEQRDALDKERLAIEKKANDATSAEKQHWADLKNQIDDVQAEINKMGVNDLGVPDAPFKETSAWSSLAIKRMLRYAVDNGFDAVTWTGGEVQADRYTEADSEKMAKRRAGMIAFYDKMLPQFTNGVIKKMGGKVETIEAGDKFLGFRINDQMRDQVAAGQALFQPDNGQAMPRGTFRPSDLLMTLSKTRNASTFLHEAGHGFLDMTMMMAQMPDAPREIQKRADDILAWMGITGTPEMSARETWMNMTLDEKRPYHEKWAETFEAYLMRGESPSLELSEAFSKFRDWLVSIYKTITEAIKTGKLPNASLNREVINIMDRLLATDQQIAEARAARAVIPLFTSKPEGMTVEAWREYQAQVGAQDAHDKHVIDRKKLSDMQWVRTKGGKLLKELQKAAAEKRKEMKIRARAAIMSQPAYIARKILTSRVAKEKLVKEKDSKYSKDIDLSRDSAMIAIAKAGGMNEALFVAEYGIDPADFKTPEMRAGHKRPVMVKKGGLRPGDVGEMLAELGYIPVDADGKFDNQAVEDLLDDEARGNPRYSYEADYGKIFGGDPYAETQKPDINAVETLAARLHRDEMHQFRFIDGIEKLAPMIADRGYPAEALAGMVGFESGEQMIRALIETKDINIAIEELTDQLMLEKYGDLSSPEALQRAVDEAMAGPARLRFLATEISIAEKSTGNRQNIYRAAKEAARNILSGIKVSAVRPDKYRVAATRASREAAAALGRGESDAVVKNKRTEALNTALFMEASSARDEIKKKLTSFRKKLKGKDEDIAKTRNMDLVNVARTILSDFGMLSEAGVARSGKAMDILKQYNPEIAQVFEDIVNDLPPAKNYKDLTLAEFRAVVQTVEAVLHRARQEKRILIEGQQYDMDEFAATVVGKLGQAGAVPAVMESTLSTKDRMVRFTMGALAHLRRAESFLELASGLDIDIFRPVNNAVRRHFQSSNGYLKEMTELLDSIKKDLSSFPIVALPGELGPKGFKFNKGKLEILHVILHMGNDSNKGKLVLGRNWGSNPDGTPDFSGLDRFIARMIDEGVITKNDMDFVQSVWDLMEKMKPDAQKAHKDMFGFHFDEITASPIVTKFGVYRGGYVPAIGDRTSALVAQRAAANELYDAGSGKMFPTTGRGFAKSRVKWDVPLELNIGLLTSHIDSVSRFTYVEPTVREIARLLNRGDVSNAFVSYHPLSLQNIINPWLESSAKQTIAPPSATPETDAAINWMNSTAGASMMAGNIANVIQQFTGFGFAAIKVRPDYLMRALFTTTRQPVSLRRNIANLDPFMKERLEGNQFELQRHIRAVVTGNGPLDTVKKGDDWIKAHAYFAQLWAQRILDPIIWQAAYDQAVSKGSADPVGDAGAAVRNTQGSFGAGDLSNIEKGSAWWRVSMKFYSYFSMQINTMTTESAKEVREKGFVRAVPRLAYMWFIVYAVTNMVAEGIMTGFPGGDDDDDEDGIFDEWMAMYFGASFRVGTASVPGVGAAAAAVAGSFDDQPFNDRLNVSPLSSYLSRALKGGIELFVPEEEGDEEFTVSEMKSLMALFGIMGLPTGQVGKTAGYVMQVEDGAIEPETEFDYLIGLARGR